MIEGLDYAISMMKRAIARHKYYMSGDYSKADKSVKMAHFSKMQACEGALLLLKRKRCLVMKEMSKK